MGLSVDGISPEKEVELETIIENATGLKRIDSETDINIIVEDFVDMCLSEKFLGGWDAVGDALSDTLHEFKQAVLAELETEHKLALEKADELAEITETIAGGQLGRYDENLYIQSAIVKAYRKLRTKNVKT